MTRRLDERTVKALPPPEKGNRVHYDTDVKGFGCRITAAGAKAFIINYRAGGRERRYTIGAHPDWSVAAARDEAKALKRRIDRGDDPMAERHEERAASTMKELCDEYLTTHASRKRSRKDDAGMIAQWVRPELGRIKVRDVTHADVEKLHRKITKAAPVRANRVAALLSKMFSLAVKWGWRADNPAKGIERNPEERRERYLDFDELERLVKALDDFDDQVCANAVRLLLYTGARAGEVLKAEWDQFDLDARVWVKPSAHTKQKKPHRIPLSEEASKLLSDIKIAATPAGRNSPLSAHVFVGATMWEPLSYHRLYMAWQEIRAAAGLDGVRLHDLRHSYASILVSSGLSLPIVGALLGHTQATTTQRYAHLHDAVLREATQRVGDAITGKPKAEVTPLRGEDVA